MTKRTRDETYVTDDSACDEAIARVQKENWPEADVDKETFAGVLIVLRDKTGPDANPEDRRFDMVIESCNLSNNKSMIALLQRVILLLQEGS